MRILSGSLRGRPIIFKPNPLLRPTPDKVRKAIVDILGEVIADASVLDLFSGTGALGLEALSAGAKQVVFCEKDSHSCANIRAMLKEWKLDHQTTLRCGDVWIELKDLAEEGNVFDVILADPPYEKGLSERLLKALDETPLLRIKGWLALEAYKTEVLPETAGKLVQKRRSVYGDTAVHYYQRSA